MRPGSIDACPEKNSTSFRRWTAPHHGQNLKAAWTSRPQWTQVDLSGKEHALLLRLASDPRRVFTKEDLLRDVWGFRSPARTRTLDTHTSRLRRKLGAAGSRPYGVNVWGVGYRLL